MLKKVFVISILFIFVLTGCTIDLNRSFNINSIRGSGKLVTYTYEVEGVEKVRLLGAGELNITQGDKDSLSIEAEDNVLDHLDVNVVGDTLKIGFENGWNIVPTRTIVITLMVKDLSLIEVSGAGEVKGSDIDTDSLDVILNGGGSFILSGKADTQNVEFNGAGSYDAGNLQSQDVNVTSNGAGTATVWAEKTLKIVLNGAGSLSYYGSPQVSETINGIGSINHLGER